MTFAERLKYFREMAKLNQKELAEKIGIPFQTYNNYETKGNEPKIEILIKLANSLGIDVNTLVGFQKTGHEDSLMILRSADINFEIDKDDSNFLFVENDSNPELPKERRMEIAYHISFNDLDAILKDVRKEVYSFFAPVFYRTFQDRMFKYKMKSPYDPKDRVTTPAKIYEQFKKLEAKFTDGTND